MDTVTDILAFAATNADYWTEFLGGQDYSAVLTLDEVKALEAARLHIEDGAYELLALCGKLAAEKLKGDGVVSRSFQPGATKRNRLVALTAPTAFAEKLYRLTFALAPDDANDRVNLYASLVVKKEHLTGVKAKLAAANVDAQVNDYDVYAPGIPLEEGKRLDEIAGKGVAAMAALFKGLK